MKLIERRLDEIDSLFTITKTDHDTDSWAKWSGATNRELWRLIKKGHPYTPQLRYVWAYWLNRHKLLEITLRMTTFTSPRRTRAENRRVMEQLEVEGPELRKLALTEDITAALQMLPEELQEVMEQLGKARPQL